MIIIKSITELNKMKVSGKILGTVLQELYETINPGITTMELNNIAESIIYKAGAAPKFKNYRGFPFSICASKNEVAVHGFPNHEPLEEGDIITVDVGVSKENYCSDAAFTKAIGTPSKKIEEFLETGKECLEKGISKCKENNRVGDISNIIHKTALSRGYDTIIGYGGHGIGIDLHEEPKIPNAGKEGDGNKLKVGMAVAVEPILSMGDVKTVIGNDGWSITTRSNSLTCHFEHTVFITENGPEILSYF